MPMGQNLLGLGEGLVALGAGIGGVCGRSQGLRGRGTVDPGVQDRMWSRVAQAEPGFFPEPTCPCPFHVSVSVLTSKR